MLSNLKMHDSESGAPTASEAELSGSDCGSFPGGRGLQPKHAVSCLNLLSHVYSQRAVITFKIRTLTADQRGTSLVRGPAHTGSDGTLCCCFTACSPPSVTRTLNANMFVFYLCSKETFLFLFIYFCNDHMNFFFFNFCCFKILNF